MAKEALASAPFLAVGAAPHWHCGRTIKGMMRDILIALAPAALAAIYYYGMGAARVMALSIATAVVVEVLSAKAMDREVMVDDMHAVVTGLLFAFMLPAAAPWWLVVAGSAITMLVGKMLFGGLGGAPICAPAAGWAICRVSWPLYLDIDATMLQTEMVNPLTQLKYFGVDQVADISTMHLLAGNQLGALGAVQAGALLLGGVYLIARGVIRWEIPVSFLAGVVALGGLFTVLDPASSVSPVFHLLTGGTMLGAFFLMTDTSSSPLGQIPMIVFGLIGGALLILIRTYGQYPDGIAFAVLLANMTSPLVDLIKPKPFGAR